MEKHTMRDYVLQTPAVLRRLLTEHWEAPLAAAFAARPVLQRGAVRSAIPAKVAVL